MLYKNINIVKIFFYLLFYIINFLHSYFFVFKNKLRLINDTLHLIQFQQQRYFAKQLLYVFHIEMLQIRIIFFLLYLISNIL